MDSHISQVRQPPHLLGRSAHALTSLDLYPIGHLQLQSRLRNVTVKRCVLLCWIESGISERERRTDYYSCNHTFLVALCSDPNQNLTEWCDSVKSEIQLVLFWQKVIFLSNIGILIIVYRKASCITHLILAAITRSKDFVGTVKKWNQLNKA